MFDYVRINIVMKASFIRFILLKSNWQSFIESLQMQVKITNGKRPF